MSPRPRRVDRVPLDAPVPCRNYEIWGPHPKTGTRTCLWAGECVDTPNRGPRDRFTEHLESVWGDTIPTRDYDLAVADGTFVLHPNIYPTKRHARVAERARIIALEPLYNWEENHLNPHQIPKWDQEAQRAERDRDRGIPHHQTWAALTGRTPVTGWRRALVWWGRLRRRQRSRIISGVALLAVCAALTTVVLLASSLSVATSVTLGVGVPLLAMLWFNQPPRRRRMRYAANEATRYALIGAIAVQLIYDLYL